MMLQWTGGSRRKVATSRKSTHSRQKQYFEQRKRRRQDFGHENCANESNKLVFCNTEPRSLDILNLINLVEASQRATTEPAVALDSSGAKISDDNLLGKSICSNSTPLETRLEQATNSSNSNLHHVSQADSYNCAGHANKRMLPGFIPEHISNLRGDKSHEKNENPQIETTVLDLLGDDVPFSNGRSIPETHVALSVEGLGKIGNQTPTHSPRMQKRFSCKGISMGSKTSRKGHSASALESPFDGCNEELKAMIDDFRVSPLCSKGGPWDYVDAQRTRKSTVEPVLPYSHEDQAEKISIDKKAFDSCFLASDEKRSNDSFGFLEKQFNRETYDSASHNQRFSYVGYPFWNSSTNKSEKIESSDIGIRDTFLGNSSCLWKAGKIFEASGMSTHFKHSTSQKDDNPSFIWESDATNAEEMFNSPTWSFLPTEEPQYNTTIFSEDSNSSNAVRSKRSLNFQAHSTEIGENKTKSRDKFQMFTGERSFKGISSEDDNIFTGFRDTIWEKKQKSHSALKKSDVENIFLPEHNFPSEKDFSPDPFNSFTVKSTMPSSYESMFEDDHFELFPTPKSKFKVPSERKPPSDFINQNEMFGKQSAFEFNLHTPMRPSTKTKSFGRHSCDLDFSEENCFTHQEYNEDRGSSGKPQPKDCEKISTSTENAESVAGAETLSKISEHKKSKSEIPKAPDSQVVETSNEEAEVTPTIMEEFPTQIQNYVRSKLNQFQEHSPGQSHRSNEEFKARSEPENKFVQSECGGSGDASYQVMLQSYVFQLLCVQKVLLEASEKDIKKKI